MPKTFNILTYNIGLCPQKNDYKENDSAKSKFNLIKDYVNSYLEKPNSIAVLQEIPYKILIDKKNKEWRFHDLFKEFKKVFPENDYSVIYKDGCHYLVTVVLSKNVLIAQDKSVKLTNRFVPFKINNSELSLLAVHVCASTPSKLKDWLYQVGPYHPNIILGDFNSGDYTIKDGKFPLNRKAFLSLSEGYIDLCHGEHTTNQDRDIDHILLERNDDFLSKYKYNNIEVNREIVFSDHYPISFQLTINE